MTKKIYCPYFLTGTEFDWINNVTPVDTAAEADIVVFSGGADINPSLYGCLKHSTTHFNQRRDNIEVSCFKSLSPNQLVIGLCRGSQMSCAMHGGKLIQNVHGHSGSDHFITNGEDKFKISSIHHQMMYPFDMDKNDYKLLYWSAKRLSDVYEGDAILKPVKEPEVVLFTKKGLPPSLAIQGHPEMMSPCKAHEVFNAIIKDLL